MQRFNRAVHPGADMLPASWIDVAEVDHVIDAALDATGHVELSATAELLKLTAYDANLEIQVRFSHVRSRAITEDGLPTGPVGYVPEYGDTLVVHSSCLLHLAQLMTEPLTKPNPRVGKMRFIISEAGGSILSLEWPDAAVPVHVTWMSN